MELEEKVAAGRQRLYADAISTDPAIAAEHFDRKRLALARQRAGWTRRDLALELDVPTSDVRMLEQGIRTPTADDVLRFATKLGLPVWYFKLRYPVIEVPEATAHFRKRSRTQAERLQALATASHLAEITRYTGKFMQLPALDLPRLSPDTCPEEDRPKAAARLVRDAWEIGDDGFFHLIRQMELHGIVVSMASFGAHRRIDAFACEPPELGRPLVVLPLDKSDPLRRRFNAAHELGHLVMHSDKASGDVQQEHEADRFAIELLMPEKIVGWLPWRLAYWPWMRDAQEHWGVSMRNLAERARELGRMKRIIADRYIREIRKFRIEEGGPRGHYDDEWPSMLSFMVERAEKFGLTPETLAVAFGLPYNEVCELLSLPTAAEEKPQLRLV